MTSARSLLPWVLLAAVSAGAAAACQTILGIDDIDGVPRVGTNGRDGGTDSSASPPEGCFLRHPVDRPPNGNTDGKTGDGNVLVFALRTVGFVPDSGVYGYDLDDHCTGDPSSSSRSKSSCVSLVPSVAIPNDDPEGVDNQFPRLVRLFPTQGAANDVFASSLNEQIAKGLHGAVFVVRNYNGEEDDDDVKVAIVASEGLESANCAAPTDAGEDGAPLKPTWDGCDTWTYVPGTVMLQKLPASNYTGYVRGRMLVIQPRSATISQDLTFPFSQLSLRLYDGILTARFVERTGGDGGTSLQMGTLAGRVKADELLELAGGFEYKEGKRFCQDAIALGLIKESLCKGRDINAARILDETETAPCDSISLGIGFTAEPANLGGEGNAPIDAGCQTKATCNP